MSDASDLSDFARTGSTDAFARLVGAHVNTVYSAARRQVRDAQLAEDVTQAVFIVLMRRAKSIRSDVPLIGWLLKTTYFASRDALKAEHRRRRHEQKAAAMKPLFTVAPDNDISPELDSALARLGELDRGIIALRYLEEKTIPEIAGGLSISPEAATKRLTRALAKLRGIMLHRRTISAAIPIETFLAAVPRLLAPLHLAGASIAAATGASTTANTMIAKGVIKMMIWSHAKVAIILAMGAIAVSTLAVGAHSLVHAQTRLRSADSKAQLAAASSSVSHRCIAQLSDGPSIEILGVAERDDTTHEPLRWWSADGSILDFGPYAKMSYVSFDSPEARIRRFISNLIEREVAIRVHSAVTANPESASYTWYFLNAGDAGSTTPQDEHGRYVQNLTGLLVELPDDPQGATLHADFATGPWNTIITKGTKGSASLSAGATRYLVRESFDVRGEAHLTCTITSDQDSSVQIATRAIATTITGATVQGYMSSSSSTAHSTAMEIVFPIRSARIKEIRLQSRPWNKWVEIRHIALHSEKPSIVQIVSSDQPGTTAQK